MEKSIRYVEYLFHYSFSIISRNLVEWLINFDGVNNYLGNILHDKTGGL